MLRRNRLTPRPSGRLRRRLTQALDVTTIHRGIEMSISKSELVEMNDLLAKGKKIADLAKKYPQYDYWEIYWQVNDYSFLGKKRTITNRLKRLVTEKTTEQRRQTADEAQELLNELYDQLKRNSAKLIEIDRVLRAK